MEGRPIAVSSVLRNVCVFHSIFTHLIRNFLPEMARLQTSSIPSNPEMARVT